MKTTHLICLWLLLIGSLLSPLKAQDSNNYFLHTIERGQSLYSIAVMYRVTTDDIVKLNPGCEEQIFAGQQLRIPRSSSTSDRFHTIQAGETLYKLTQLYGVTADEICRFNPGLSAANFRIGQVVLLPPASRENRGTVTSAPSVPTVSTQGPVVARCREMHRVARKETIFSVSRSYGITEAELIAANPELKDGMKRGQLLCIPYPTAQATNDSPAAVPEKTSEPRSDEALFKAGRQTMKRPSNNLKVGLLLPFASDKRMVEYYEGFLLAVDSLKRVGTSVDLYVYDCADDAARIKTLLGKDEMKHLDILFGPMSQSQIPLVAQFARDNNVRMVIPFSSKDDEVFHNPSVYQINTPQSYLYSEVYEHFFRQFTNVHAVFIESSQPDKEKADFVKGFKNEMKRRGVSMTTVHENAMVDALKTALRADRTNVFIPTSGENVMLIKILPQLKILVREMPEFNICLFGYPEWQTYTRDHLDSFFELDTYFYSSFYTNTLFPAAAQFSKDYRRWYGKILNSRFPNYAMLGFDTGFFFLKGLSVFGNDLESRMNEMKLTPIQTGFKFERVNNWGGFINKKVFFIRFNRNYDLEKLDFE